MIGSSNRLLAALVAPLLAAGAARATDVAALEGAYRVEGECAERTEDGEYRTCLAWNELKLRPLPDGRVAFFLSTSTFATTAGGCELSGHLTPDGTAGVLRLVGTDAADATCMIALEVRPRVIVLTEPARPVEACRLSCARNSSLYSDPFPRKSRRPLLTTDE